MTQILCAPAWKSMTHGSVTMADVDLSAATKGWMPRPRTCMACCRKKQRIGKLFAATAFGLHSSDDDGGNWTFQKLDFAWQYTRSIVERPDRTGVMYLTNGSGSPGLAWASLPKPGLWRDLAGCVARIRAKLDLFSGGESSRSDARVRGRLAGSAVSDDRWRRYVGRAAAAAR